MVEGVGNEAVRWLKVLDKDELPEGRVKTASCAHRTLCMSHYKGEFAAFDNRCPHQGGPLGEGSIENGLLRCPWHGWDYDPLNGKAPGFDDGLESFPVSVREDGVYVGLPKEKEHVPTVGDIMMETMSQWGVKQVFGMVGHSNLGVAEALRLQEEAGKINFYGIRHEGAAAFACSAYGKLTGRLAACLSIAGPGATNLLTGLWDAHVDRSPTLALTGQVDSQVLGAGAFQEVDLDAAYGGVAQWSQTVLHTSRFSELMNLACKSALLNRGVSHLIFPDEIPKMIAPESSEVGSPQGRITAQKIAPPPESLEAAIDLLKNSERPLIIVGHGARQEMPAIITLAEQMNSPVVTTFKAKGQISDQHALAAGVLGRSGTPIASWLMNEADLLLVFGASFSNHTGISSKIPTIQIDFDPMALGRFHPVTVPVWGEIGITADLLHKGLESVPSEDLKHQDQRKDIQQRWQIWCEEKAQRRADDNGKGLNSALIFDVLSKDIPDNSIIAVDVGNNTYSFGRYFECREQAVLMSGYLGSIGFSFPAAMGAWAATQEDDPRFKGRQVVSISGDGGFGQYLAELTTAVKYSMNITHILLNNDQLGKISKEQKAGNWDVWQTSLHNPNFAEYAKLCGAFGIRVEKPSQLSAALEQALAYDGPALIEILSDPDLI